MREQLAGATAVMNPSATPEAVERRLEVGDVGRDQVLAGIGERARCRPGPAAAGRW